MQRVVWPRDAAWWTAALAELSREGSFSTDRCPSSPSPSPSLPDSIKLRLTPAQQAVLVRALARGARLECWSDVASTGPCVKPRSSRHVDGPRLAWWPSGSCDARLVGLASSRLPRALDTIPELFRFVRAAMGELATRGERLVVVEGMAASGLILRAAEVHRMPVLRIVVATDGQPLEAWIRTRLRQPLLEAVQSGCSAQQLLYLSPPLDGIALPSLVADLPAADRVLFSVADRIDILDLRRGGVWHALLRHAAGGGCDAGPGLRVAAEPKLVGPRLFKEIVPRCAAAWTLATEPPNETGTLDASCVSSAAVVTQDDATQGETNLMPVAAMFAEGASHELSAEYLIHFTRRCDGPWPGQLWADFWDDLLEERAEKDRSAVAVLSRILREDRILASSRAIRGQASVVCFSAVPLGSLVDRRVWRKHRRRWDFEPFGLAIRRKVLESLGARPVLYGDEARWQSLADADRPFFQKSDMTARFESYPATSNDEPSARTMLDWRGEQEWRVLGDVDLAKIARQDALIFVPDREAARAIARWSRFRFAILKDS